MHFKFQRLDGKPKTLADYLSRRRNLSKSFFALSSHFANQLPNQPKSIHNLWIIFDVIHMDN